MKSVTTYQLAYMSNKRVTLCDECSVSDHVTSVIALGPVSHGARPGECEACDRIMWLWNRPDTRTPEQRAADAAADDAMVEAAEGPHIVRMRTKGRD